MFDLDFALHVFHERHVIIEVNREKGTDIYCSEVQVLNPRQVSSIADRAFDAAR